MSWVEEVLRAHVIGDAQGGSSTGSWCACTCGERNFINSTRDMARRKAEAHLADALRAAMREQREAVASGIHRAECGCPEYEVPPMEPEDRAYYERLAAAAIDALTGGTP